MQRAIASFGSLKTLIFACKTNSSTFKNTTQNAPKPTILRTKIKQFSEEGHSPLRRPLHQWGGRHPSPHLSPFGAYGTSIFAPAALKLGAIGASILAPAALELGAVGASFSSPLFFLPSAAYDSLPAR